MPSMTPTVAHLHCTATQRVQTGIIDAWSQVDKLLHKGVS